MVKRKCYILTSMSFHKDPGRRLKDNCSWGLIRLSHRQRSTCCAQSAAFFASLRGTPAPPGAHRDTYPYPAGRSVAPYPLSPTREQRTQAEETLLEVHSTLQHDGMSSSQIEMLVRVGSPADELAAVASKRHIDCIVIGSRGNSPGQRFRRWLIGSTSRRVLKLAPCPVLVVTLPRSRGPRDLVAWYEAAILQSLHDQPAPLTIFTAQEVAGRFLPHQTHTVGRKERIAATHALKHLADTGVLCRREMHGEVWYLND